MKKKKGLLATALLFAASLSFAQTENYWKLVFEENFDGNALNKSNWSVCPRGTPDWTKYLVDSPSTIQVADGNLTVRAIKNPDTTTDKVPYLTSGVKSAGKFNFKYGKIEIRAKFNNGQGSWPAIWMMPEDGTGGWPTCGEIDIIEHLNFDTYVYQTIHSYYGNTLKITTNPPKSATPTIVSYDYNVYGLQWYPDRLEFMVNGAVKFTYPRITTDKQGQWPFDKKFYIILNMAAGGSWGGAITESQLPFQMQVDYVKVYQRNPDEAYTQPVWSSTYAQNDSRWKDTYVTNITSTGAVNNLNYQVSARPESYYNLYPDTLELTPGQNFTLNMKAFSLGEYSTTVTKQDLRYTCFYAFADFDGDKLFETILNRIGSVPPSSNIGGNFDVLDTSETFAVPETLRGKTGRIRLVYRNAWSEVLSPELAVKDGLVYDFDIKVANPQSGIAGISLKPTVSRQGNVICLSGVSEKSQIALFDFTGKMIFRTQVSQPNCTFAVPNGFCILQIRNTAGEVWSQKL